MVSSRVIPKDTKLLFSISEDGLGKATPISEFNITNTNTKGVAIQKSDKLCDFLPLSAPSDILINSSTTQIRIESNEIPELSRGTIGVKLIKLTTNHVIGISSL